MPLRTHTRSHASLLRAGVYGAMLAIAIALLLGGHASAASSTTTITVTVASATNIDASGCTAGVVGKTDLGTLLPSQTALGTADCSVIFGSSNDTSMLRVSQSDALGVGMFSASKGTLDTAFDTDGIQTTVIGNNHDYGHAAALQADGKIVVAGSCDTAGGGPDFCVVRYTAAGALDTSFDTDGKQVTAIGPGTAEDNARAVAIQADGKIVLVGYCDMTGAVAYDVCLTRYTAAGALDTTFDTDGIQVTAVGGANDYGTGVVVQSDGKIVVGGDCDMGATSRDFCLLRYTATGALDTSYDTDGIVTTPFTGAATGDYIKGLLLQPDGMVLATGYCNMGATGYDFCLSRYTASGALDTAFDTDGKTTTLFIAGGTSEQSRSAALQPDGKIVLAGQCDNGVTTGMDFCLARYTTTGALDTTFDTDGKTTTAIASGTDSDDGRSVAVAADGKIIIAGFCYMGAASNNDMCLARFTTDGALDTTFDTDGKLSTAISPGAISDYAYQIISLPDGELLAAGYCTPGASSHDFCLANYAANGSFSDYVNATSDWDTAPSTNMFGACLQSVSGGAAGTWTVDPGGACTAVDTDPWNDIPIAADKVAYAASAGTVAATANLRFGLRTSSSQPPGTYLAPITFDVVAPNA